MIGRVRGNFLGNLEGKIVDRLVVYLQLLEERSIRVDVADQKKRNGDRGGDRGAPRGGRGGGMEIEIFFG